MTDCVYVTRPLTHGALKTDGHFRVPEGYEFRAFIKIENGYVTFVACEPSE